MGDARRAGGLPPFGRLAALVISANEHDAAFSFARRLLAQAPRAEDVRLFGPVDAPLAMLRGRHRVRLLVKAPKGAPIQAALMRWTGGLKLPGGLRLSVDIDPQSFW